MIDDRIIALEKRVMELERRLPKEAMKWWETNDDKKRNQIIDSLTLEKVTARDVKLGDLLVFDDPYIGKWVQEVVVIEPEVQGLMFLDHLPGESGGGIGGFGPDELVQRIVP